MHSLARWLERCTRRLRLVLSYAADKPARYPAPRRTEPQTIGKASEKKAGAEGTRPWRWSGLPGPQGSRNDDVSL